jgi:hypothetical protein
MALSNDRRKRVLEAVVEDGLSRNAAAKHFKVSIASTVRRAKRYVHMSEPARERHGGVVNDGHLRREHQLHLVLRLQAFDHREHEIEPALVHHPAFCHGIGELSEKPVSEVRFRCSKRLHK